MNWGEWLWLGLMAALVGAMWYIDRRSRLEWKELRKAMDADQRKYQEVGKKIIDTITERRRKWDHHLN